jgi:hypothetical protein
MQNPRGAMRVLRARHSRVAALESCPGAETKCIFLLLFPSCAAGAFVCASEWRATFLRWRRNCVSRARKSAAPTLISRSFSSRRFLRRPAAEKEIQYLSRRRTTLSINFAALMQSYCLICMVIDGGTRVELELLPFHPPPAF